MTDRHDLDNQIYKTFAGMRHRRQGHAAGRNPERISNAS